MSHSPSHYKEYPNFIQEHVDNSVVYIDPFNNQIEHVEYLRDELNSSKKCLTQFGLDYDSEKIRKRSVTQYDPQNLCAAETKKSDIISENLHQNNDLKKLSSWNLPPIIVQEYAKKGITEMFNWQMQCLCLPNILSQKKNLIYSAPTSAGKTLVSEILIIKTLLDKKKKALFILPYISLVKEKMTHFQDILITSGYRVEGYFGGYSPPGAFETINLAICTIEKANSIVNKLLEENKLHDIGIVIVDEIHLISDPNRGYILELLLAKILFVSQNLHFQHHIQIVAMSATLPNVDILQNLLNAEFYTTNFRPVELKEMIKINNQIFDKNMRLIRTLENMEHLSIKDDQDHIIMLCIESILAQTSVLIFCPTKDWCEKLCMNIAKSLHELSKSNNEISRWLQENKGKVKDLKIELKKNSIELDVELLQCFTYCCAFHHAGLTVEEREIIESNFRNSVLKIVVATSTLSSGVNLPSRRVIIRSPLFGGKRMSLFSYRQMSGRAGRTGMDSKGESILICNSGNLREGKELMKLDLPPIISTLHFEHNMHLNRALLEVISAGVARTRTDLHKFIACTLLGIQMDQNEIAKVLTDSIGFLIEYEFVRIQNNIEINQDIYIASRLGKACLISSLPPSDGLILLAELQKSRRCFVLETDINALYLVTPYSVCSQIHNIDWLKYLDIWEKLLPAVKQIGTNIGVTESFLIKAMRGSSKLDYKSLQIHKRFYATLALQELINEIPLRQVAQKYNFPRGILQSLQQMSSTFAGILTLFCRSLNWETLALIISQFKERLYFGIHNDLIDLVRLPEINSIRARAFFNAGITTLTELANANAHDVENILYNSISFDSTKKQDGEDQFDADRRNQIRNIIITGNSKLTIENAARMFIANARKFLQLEIGVDNIDWNNKTSNYERISIQNSFTTDENNGGELRKDDHNTKLKENIREIEKLSHMSLNADKDKENCEFLKFIHVIDICGNLKLFEMAILEICKNKIVGLSIAIKKWSNKMKNIEIGFDKNSSQTNDCYTTFDFFYNEIHFISGISFFTGDNIVYFFNMQLQNTDINLTKERKLLGLKSILENEELTFRIYDSKEQLLIMKKALPLIDIPLNIEDPKIAAWLLQPDEIINIEKMITDFSRECIFLWKLLKSDSVTDFYLKSIIESCVVYRILNSQIKKLENIADGQLWRCFKELEMPIQRHLAHMEYVGISIHKDFVIELIETIRENMRKLELNFYKINGRHLNSNLNLNLILGLNNKVRATRAILEASDNPIAHLILIHKKLYWTLHHSLLPLLKNVHGNRIYQKNITTTSTGRITMNTPNLQNVPKNYTIDFEDKQIISCRSLFVSSEGNCFLSADYCQLEMRILTHLSQDPILINLIHADCDVFTAISAKWNNIKINEVSEKLRNGTKQIFYGIIYGMSVQKLSESLKCTENEAIVMSESFHETYPGIKIYIKKVLEFARQNGFIETISGRRRYLKNIKSKDNALRSHAERQAVNSSIQGSAADISKSAIIRMGKNLSKYDQKLNNLTINGKNRINLVHHLHDELIYEIPKESLANIAKILKLTMENCIKLNIPLQVKLKTGDSWGNLKEYTPISCRTD